MNDMTKYSHQHNAVLCNYTYSMVMNDNTVFENSCISCFDSVEETKHY